MTTAKKKAPRVKGKTREAPQQREIATNAILSNAFEIDPSELDAPISQSPVDNNPQNTRCKQANSLPTKDDPPAVWAAHFARMGIKIFPCHYNEPNLKKPPLIENWQKKATCDPIVVANWWKQWPDALIGIPTGSINGIDVLDIDMHGVDGHLTFPMYSWVNTPRVKTPTGGHHLWALHIPGLHLANWSGQVQYENEKIATPGVDVRTTGGYVIGPGSRTPVGVYEFERGSEVDLRAPMDQLLRLLVHDATKGEKGKPKVRRPEPQPSEDEGESQGTQRNRTDAERDRYRLCAELAAMAPSEGKGRNPRANEIAYELGPDVRMGLLDKQETVDFIFQSCQSNGLVKDDGEQQTLASIWSGMNAGISKAAPKKKKGRPKNNDEGFAISARGEPLVTFDNVRLALDKLGAVLTYNEFSDQMFIAGVEGVGPRVSDACILKLRARINDAHGFWVGEVLARETVTVMALENTYPPVRDYLDAQVWDGTSRVDTWLIEHAGAADTAFNRAVSRILLVAAVRRIRKPGVKFDEMVVLESKQGTNKSSSLRLMAVKDEWFSDSLSLRMVSQGDDKKAMEQLAGKWIVEVPELQGLRDSQVEGLKSFLSRQVDSSRLAFGHLRTDAPRQTVIIGTTNAAQYLKDDTGNRRFWPVKVERVNMETLAAARDQLWAEAAELEAKGESIRLPEALWPEAARLQQARLEAEAWADILNRALCDEHGQPIYGKITQANVWKLLSVGSQYIDQKKAERLRIAMEQIGFEKRKLRFEGGAAQVGFIRGEFGGKLSKDNCREILITCFGDGTWHGYLEGEPKPKDPTPTVAYAGGEGIPY